MSTDICNEWLQNKLVNPRTGRVIKPTGKVYQDLSKECLPSSSSRRVLSMQPSQAQPDEGNQKLLEAHQVNITKDPMQMRLVKVLLTRLHESLAYLLDPDTDPSTGKPIEPLRKNILEVESNQLQQSFNVQRDLTFKRYNEKTKVMTKVITEPNACKDVVNKFKRLPQTKPIEQGYTGSINKVPVNVISTRIRGKASVQYSIGTLVNYLINAQVCPNYQYSFTERVCDDCGPLKVPEEEQPEKQPKKQKSKCAFIFKEAYDLTLADLFSSEQPPALELSILGQLIMAVHYLNHNLGILHDDLLSKNIYLKRTPELQGHYMVYMVQGLGMFLVENQGYMVTLGNFSNVKVIDESMMKFRSASDKYRMYSAFVQDNLNILRVFHGGEHNKGTHEPLKISPTLKWILYQFDKDPSLNQFRRGKVVGATILLDIIKLVYKEGDFNMIRSLAFHPDK